MRTSTTGQTANLYNGIRLCLLFWLCLGLLFSFANASAEGIQEEGSLEVGILQERLKELGYFDTTPTFRYDLATQLALKKCCEENGLAFSDKEIVADTYYAIMTLNDIKPKPERAQFQYLSAGSEGQDVLDLQLRLKELGYFANLVYTACLYDDATQKAVELFCTQNSLNVSFSGASENMQYVIFSDYAEAYAPPKQRITLGSEGQGIMELQLRLKELGYFNGQLGVYDSETHSAVELFCKENNLVSATDSVDENTQYVLFSDTAIAYAPPTPGFFEKVGAFFQATVAGVPTWFICLAMLSCITLSVVILRILRPKKQRVKNAEPQIPVFSLKERQSPPSTVQLVITFDGERKSQSLLVDHPITIGRRNADIQLARRDKQVSRIHGKLEKRGNQLIYYDTSSNGTNINEIFVHKNEYPIHDGDRLQISHHTIQVFWRRSG